MTVPGAGTPWIFGEVLFDRFPTGEEVLGGAPFNVAWNLQALGARPRFVSRVGDDALGRRIRDAMSAWEMDTAGVQVDREHATGTVSVTFADGEPRFEIDPDRAWDFVDPSTLPDPTGAGLLYHGSLALRSDRTRTALATLARRAATPVFIDVNLRAPWWDAVDVASRLRSARWAKLNEDELQTLAPAGSSRSGRIAGLFDGTSLDALIVTRGADGAEVHRRDGQRHAVRPPANTAVVDTVGAGDAFASVVILGLIRAWAWPVLLERAQEFAAAVVNLRGATTRERAFYDTYVNRWENR